MGLYKHAGVTLIEIILVIVIGAAIIILGMRQYQSFRIDADVQQLKYNVDMIFQAMADYYQANCKGGTLDPTSPFFAGTNPVPIDITTLRNQAFLTANLLLSPIIESTGPGGGYILQFNRVTPDPDRMIGSIPIGKIVLWKAQVAAQFTDDAKALRYRNLLAAECTSALTGNAVSPCTSGSAGNYVVWERLPSFAVPASGSGYGLSNARLKQFNQMYTTYPILYLTSGFKTSSQYYLCGS